MSVNINTFVEEESIVIVDTLYMNKCNNMINFVFLSFPAWKFCENIYQNACQSNGAEANEILREDVEGGAK